MSFILRGPYPGIQTKTRLPSPKWGDSKSLTATVISLRSMDGKLFTPFEFQGKLLDVWQAGKNEGMTMNITQKVTAVLV